MWFNIISILGIIMIVVTGIAINLICYDCLTIKNKFLDFLVKLSCLIPWSYFIGIILMGAYVVIERIVKLFFGKKELL
jgi:hypothetical protein